MKNLTVHQKINFRSNFNPDNDSWYMRLTRPIRFTEMMSSDDRVTYSTEIPFWSELGGYFTSKTRFKNKF